MKWLIFILLSTLSLPCLAGLPHQYDWGDKVSAPLFNRHLSPISATISLTPDTNFRKCFFDITFEIDNDTSLVEIPLLLYIDDILGDTINFWVDGKPIDGIGEIPDSLQYIAGSIFSDFSNYFLDTDEVYDANDTSAKEPDYTTLRWFHHLRNENYDLNKFHYINSSIAKGRHTIRINYAGSRWTYLLDVAKNYSYRYSLTPALKWHPIIPIKVIVNNQALSGDYTLNIGTLVSKKPNTYQINGLDTLRDDFLAINWQPKMNPYASAWLFIDPTRTTLWFGIILVAFNFYCLFKFRRWNNSVIWLRIFQLTAIFIPFTYITIRLVHFMFENHSQEQTLSMSIILIGIVGCLGVWNEAKQRMAMKPMHVTFILSSLLIAFIIPHIYLSLYEIIYWLLGPEAGKWDDERLLVFILIPIIFPVHIVSLYILDRYWRRKYLIVPITTDTNQ